MSESPTTSERPPQLAALSQGRISGADPGYSWPRPGHTLFQGAAFQKAAIPIGLIHDARDNQRERGQQKSGDSTVVHCGPRLINRLQGSDAGELDRAAMLGRLRQKVGRRQDSPACCVRLWE